MSELAQYEHARSALAACASVDEAKTIRDKAEALRAYGRQMNDHELETWAAEIKVRASRRIGEISKALEKAKHTGRAGEFELPPSGSSKTKTLKTAGITTQVASRCEKLFAIPEQHFEAVLAEKREKKQPVSAKELTARLRKAVVADVAEPEADVAEDLYATRDLGLLIARGLTFGTIYADPPWQYANQGTRAATDNHYVTMTVDELCALPVRELAAGQSHLWLWTTNGFLFECPRLFDAWGFEFKSSYVWVKPQMGIGNYLRNAHELLLLAVRGGLTAAAKDVRSWGEFARTGHSAKPERIRTDVVQRVSPGPRLELFGRRPAPGWVVYGNQVVKALGDESLREIA